MSSLPPGGKERKCILWMGEQERQEGPKSDHSLSHMGMEAELRPRERWDY